MTELGSGIQAAQDKLAALETEIGTLKTASTSDEGGLAAVEKSIEELRTALSAASGSGSDAGQAANKIEIEKLSGDLKALSDQMADVKPVDTSGLEGKLSGLEGKLSAIESELGALKEQQGQLATRTRSELGEAFAKLSGKMAGSEPFGAELDALVAEAPAVAGIDVLRPLAATGVVSPGELSDNSGHDRRRTGGNQ